MSEISHIIAQEVIDSRGNPTVWAEVTTASGARGDTHQCNSQLHDCEALFDPGFHGDCRRSTPPTMAREHLQPGKRDRCQRDFVGCEQSVDEHHEGDYQQLDTCHFSPYLSRM